MPATDNPLTAATTTTYEVPVTGIGPAPAPAPVLVPVTVTARGDGRPVLLLHGGAGPQSVDSFAALLAAAAPARVLTPLHPGFAGTPRPEQLATIGGLAQLYVALLDQLDLTGVTVIGNSIGGWIAAEIAVLNSPRVAAVVLADAVGLQVDGHPVADFFSLTMDQVADLSYFHPDQFRIDVDHLPEAAKVAMAANRLALGVYAGTAMTGPGLLDRLPGVTAPVLVVWGTADRIVSAEHGLAYTRAIPGAEFRLISDAGHLPQLETPEELQSLVQDFLRARTDPGPAPVSVVGPDEGDTLLPPPTQMRILEDGGHTGHRLGLGEITVAPHTDGPPQHRHARHDEGFYVVSGAARFTVGEKSYDAPAGSLIMVPPGAPHTFANPGDEPLVLLNTFTPDLYVQYFRDLHDMITTGRPLSPAIITTVMSKYATTPA
jgi:pimeloyl-ACP methyl ester carboxylesterase/mannose-6-phosphate isomerase-like protein (cupin superfamily)